MKIKVRSFVKRFFPLLCVLTVLVSTCIFPVGASETETINRDVLNLEDYVYQTQNASGGKFYSVSVPADQCSIYCQTPNGKFNIQNDTAGHAEFAYSSDSSASFKFCFPGNRYSEPRYYFSLDNIDAYTPYNLFTKFILAPNFQGSYNAKLFYQINFYDVNFSNIAVYPAKPTKIEFDNCSGTLEGIYSTDKEGASFTIPSGARYFGISLVMTVDNIVLDSSSSDLESISFDFTFKDYYFRYFKASPDVDLFGDLGEFAGGSFSWLGSVGNFIVEYPFILAILVIPCFAIGILSRVKKS